MITAKELRERITARPRLKMDDVVDFLRRFTGIIRKRRD